MVTIWRVAAVADLRPLFTSAGPVDQAAVQAHLATLRPDPQPPAPREPELPRWFYLYTRDQRVLLRTVTMSLEHWEGPAKVLIGTFIHLGEFADTRSFASHQVKGLRITLEPIEMLRGALAGN